MKCILDQIITPDNNFTSLDLMTTGLDVNTLNTNQFATIALIIAIAIEVSLLFLYIVKTLHIREEFNRIHFVVGYMSAISCIYVVEILDNVLLKSALSFLVLFLCIFIFTDESLMRRIFSFLLFLSILIFSNLPFLFLQNDEAVLLALSKPILIFCIILAIYFTNIKNIYFPKVYWVGFCTLFLLIITSSFLLINASHVYNDGFFNKIVVFVILLMAVFFFSFCYLFTRVSEYFEDINKRNLLTYQEETIEKYFLQKQKSDTNIMILAHDLKHNLERLGKLAVDENNDRLLRFLDEYSKKLEETKLFHVGNDVASAIIHQKINIAMVNDIVFEVRGRFENKLILSDIDISSLLGNLLDNALESALKTQEKYIELNISRKGNLLLLNIINSSETAPEVKNNMFISSKKDKQLHGIGMISIQSIVEKYSGTMTTEYHNGVFKVFIMIVGYTH